jgi:predicted nuclease of restriction endonuclease-like (RecB) superfamily
MTKWNKTINGKAYLDLLKDVKAKIISARIRALRGVNKELIRLYWEVGCLIVDKQREHKWGKSVVEKLSSDLRKSFSAVNGYSVQNLWYMRQFYLEYKEDSKLQQLVGEIPWGHNILMFCLSVLRNRPMNP